MATTEIEHRGIRYTVEADEDGSPMPMVVDRHRPGVHERVDFPDGSWCEERWPDGLGTTMEIRWVTSPSARPTLALAWAMEQRERTDRFMRRRVAQLGDGEAQLAEIQRRFSALVSGLRRDDGGDQALGEDEDLLR